MGQAILKSLAISNRVRYRCD